MGAPQALGLAIRERRSQLGLSPEEVSARVGVEPGWLAGVEDGRGDPTLDRLLSLAAALDSSLSELLHRAEELSVTL